MTSLMRRCFHWPVLALVLALGFLAAPGPGAAQSLPPVRGIRPPAAAPNTPPEQPFLRVDAEFHTQVVNRFAQEPAGRIIVTASDDKTVRIWQASDGSPLATIRVPIADGDEGAVYAVAISPDGKTLLVGGYTGVTWDRAFAIYIFDLESQRLRGRLPNLPAPINHLAYSPDGHAIAIALGGLGGMRLVDATNGSLIGSDETFHDRTTWVDFDRNGQLAVASFDGDIRLYDATGKRLARRAPVPGGHPYSVAFSPDASTIAVGYADQPRVELLSAQDLSPRPSPRAGRAPQGGGQGGGLGAVAWAANGGLFAGGSLRDSSGAVLVRYWPPGRGVAPTDWPVLHDTIFQMGATNDGGLLVVGADPALVRLDRTGHVVYRKEGPGLDFRDMADRRFEVSPDGLSVTLQTKTMPAAWLVDMGQRIVGPAPYTRGLTPVAAPATTPIAVDNWRNTAAPRIGGRPVRLEPEELSRAYARRPAQDFVVLGTDYQLRVFDAAGDAIDAAALPGPAWAVGVSGDGHTVVAAVGDGTLRWFGLDDQGHLTPLVTLFLAADGVRWVAWTSGGYFDHSDRGGKELVGLLLNRARNQVPDWFSFAQVYRLFYAPDTVAGRFRGDTTPEPAGGIAGLRDLLGHDAPPAIDLVALCWTVAGAQQCSPVNTSGVSRGLRINQSADATIPADVGAITVQYHLVGPVQGQSAVDVFVNQRNAGREAPGQAARGADGVIEQSAPLDSGANLIQLRAYDRDQAAYAQSRVIQIARSASTEPAAAGAKPKLFILSVGIDHYPPTINSLNFAVADARAVARAIKAHAPASYSGVDLTELYDEQASATGVLAALDRIAKQAQTGDTVVIYLSGHGISIDGRYYFVTQNVGSVEAVPKAAVSEAALVQALAKIRSRNGLVFLDTCHAGAFSLDTASQIAHESGRYILAASASLEEALDSYDDHNGVFATAVLRGLAGGALSGSETTINNFELGFYVTPLVHKLAVERHHDQSARFKIAAEDAQPFAIVDAKPTH